MYPELWKGVHASVCSIVAFQNGHRIASGTGFKSSDKIVTNYHVIQAPGVTDFQLRFTMEDGYSDSISKWVTSGVMEASLADSMPVDSWDYAILDLDWEELGSVPSLNLTPGSDCPIGLPIALFGYQFDQPNLSIHAVILASKFVANGVKLLQLDASVNQGNSGGPLLNTVTSDVIGIVTRKHTGLTEQFDALMQSFETNMKTLDQMASAGRVVVGGIDPNKALRLTQEQMARVSIEIRRSANVGVGYAYQLDKIKDGIRNRRS